MNNLTVSKIKALRSTEKKYKVADGGNLYLRVMPTGKMYWELLIKRGDKRSSKVLGQYPNLGLKDARLARDNYSDIPEVAKTEMNFNELINAYFTHRSEELGQKYIDDNKALLKRDFERLYDIGLDDITKKDLILCFEAAEARGIKTAHKKAGSLVNRLFKFACTKLWTDNNPMAFIDLSVLLKKHKPKQFAHITDEKQFKALLCAIEAYPGDIYTKTALRFMPYVFVRPANIRAMLWSEINFAKRTWTIPALKMKADKEHIIPLTNSMIAILMEVKDGKSDYVFPSPQTKLRMLSENTLNIGLKRLGFAGEMTSHGFRHTASTFLHENLAAHGQSHEIIEMLLAHSVGSSVSNVYNKAKYLEPKRKLLDWWSRYLDNLKACD